MRLAAADSRFDLSLRFLSVLVSGAIALALLWQFAGALTPLMRLGDAPLPTHANAATAAPEAVGPPAWAADPQAALRLDVPSGSRASFVTVFRCERHGSITYADRPCEQGGMRVLRLPRA